MTTKPKLAPAAVMSGRVGDSVRRPDAALKTRGDFPYSSDLQVDQMLWGATVRSPHAYARIVSIDLSEARSMPGVHAVLSHEDVPGRKVYGLEIPDQPVLAVDVVRGYLVAMPGQWIVARPGTLTGSIGVLTGKLVTSGLFSKPIV